jgi:hypothetical protein
MALGSTQPQIEISTKDLPLVGGGGGRRRVVRRADNFTVFMSRLSINSGSLSILEH